CRRAPTTGPHTANAPAARSGSRSRWSGSRWRAGPARAWKRLRGAAAWPPSPRPWKTAGGWPSPPTATTRPKHRRRAPWRAPAAVALGPVGAREAAARRGRVAAFAPAREDGGVLALAHHRDDQAETLLLRALRASGSDGLGAMRPSRRFARGWLWRPFLALPR